MASDDLDGAIEQSHFALGEIVRGNPEPYQVLLSHREDVTLGNPFGPFVHGWDQVAATAADAASRYRDGDRRLRSHREVRVGRCRLHRGSGAIPGQGRGQ
jgi:hypothetical protein